MRITANCGSVENEAAQKVGSSLVSDPSAYMYSGGARAAPNTTLRWQRLSQIELGIRVAGKKPEKQK
jgi:hypothetical protein